MSYHERVKTRNGVFANEGYGGGVFNYNTAFGQVPSVRGLGALATNRSIPWKCWDNPGFKDCHAVAYAEAENKCAYCAQNPQDEANCGGYTTLTDCIERETNAMAWNNCVASFCPAQDPGMSNIDLNFEPYSVGDPCGSENTIKNVQFVSGTKTDGRWGPMSQEAYETLVRVQGTTYCDLAPGCTGQMPIGGQCSAVQAPVPTPTPTPTPVPTVDPDLEEPEETVGPQTASTGVFMVAGALMLLAGAAVVLGGKKKR